MSTNGRAQSQSSGARPPKTQLPYSPAGRGGGATPRQQTNEFAEVRHTDPSNAKPQPGIQRLASLSVGAPAHSAPLGTARFGLNPPLGSPTHREPQAPEVAFPTAQGDLVKNHSPAAAASGPHLNSFVPRLANLQRLQEQWDESGRDDTLDTRQAHHDSLRILIVTDDMRSAAKLKRTLHTLGYSETLVAYSGRRALAAVAGYSPSVAIVDLELADMTGYSLARSLRTHITSQVRKLPLIAVAERGEFAAGELARAAGFLGLLTKPVPSWLLNGLLLRSLL